MNPKSKQFSSYYTTSFLNVQYTSVCTTYAAKKQSLLNIITFGASVPEIRSNAIATKVVPKINAKTFVAARVIGASFCASTSRRHHSTLVSVIVVGEIPSGQLISIIADAKTAKASGKCRIRSRRGEGGGEEKGGSATGR